MTDSFLPPDKKIDLAALFDRALELNEADRQRLLAEVGAVDGAKRARLESLLKADANESLLPKESSAWTLGVGTRRLGAVARGDRIGEFSVGEIIGRGGMGSVFRAHQESTGREVALKVLNDAFASEESLLRFGLEGRILGTMDHPHIARVFAAGINRPSEDPIPWIAMELVEGVDLSTWIETESPSIDTRLRVLADVAEAIQHAHTKGIVHRDLKPANILVDGEGRARVLDFGVARISDPEVQSSSFATDPGRMVGTIHWMSPEQTEGDPDRIDARSDVHSLGLLLHHALSGRAPYELDRSDLHRTIENIRHQEPEPLGAVDRRFGGDLEIIARHALEKEPERRYQTAAAFADDLRRHLSQKPILARPSSAWYRFSRFARRNRVAVSLAGAGLLALVTGLIGSISGWTEAIDQKEEAGRQTEIAKDEARQADDARKVAVAAKGEAEARTRELAREESRLRRLNEILRLSLTPSNREASAEDFAATRKRLIQIEKDMQPLVGSDPASRGAFFAMLGNARRSIGDLEAAESLLTQAQTILTEAHGAESVPVAEVQIGRALIEGAKEDSARDFSELFREALAILEKNVPADDARLLHARAEYARALGLDQRFEEVKEEATKGLAASKAKADDPALLLDRVSLRLSLVVALQELDQAKAAQAELEILFEEAAKGALPEDHPILIRASKNAGELALRSGRVARSIEHFQKAADGALSRFGTSSDEYARLTERLLDYHVSAKRWPQAARVLAKLSDFDFERASAKLLCLRGEMNFARRKVTEAESDFRKALEKADPEVRRGDRLTVLRARFGLAQSARRGRRNAEAKEILEESLDLRRRWEEESRTSFPFLEDLRGLAGLLPAREHGARRHALNMEVLERAIAKSGPNSREAKIYSIEAATTALMMKDYKESARLYAPLMSMLGERHFARSPQRLMDQLTYAGCAHLRADLVEESLSYFERALALGREKAGFDSSSSRTMLSLLSEAYGKLKRTEDQQELHRAFPKRLKPLSTGKKPEPGSASKERKR